ncbi:MAG TPA: MerR family transcriptional regulator [Panacibacter sp.]|nr:MerR family transcriptional regulator [Panacibacter sp.]
MQQLDLFAAFEDEKQPHAVKDTAIPNILPFTGDEDNTLIAEDIAEITIGENSSAQPQSLDHNISVTTLQISDENIPPATIAEHEAEVYSIENTSTESETFALEDAIVSPENKEENIQTISIAEHAAKVIITENTTIEPESFEDESLIAPPEILKDSQEPSAIEKTVKAVKIKEPKITTSKRGRMSFKEMDADLVMVEVPEDAVLFQKQYYGMREVAKWFHVNQSLLRYWENEFDILKPRKTRKGDRLFRPEDIKNLELIYFLLRQRKFSLEGAKQYLKENKQKADVHMQLMQSLTKFRSFLLEWKAILSA